MTYQGCYSDQNPSALSLKSYSRDDNSIELCTATCAASSYRIAGLEFGRECWCGNSMNYKTRKTADQGCAMTCSGNSSELCGDSNRLSVFSTGNVTIDVQPQSPSQVGSYSLLGCYNEAKSGRALSDKSTSQTDMSVEKCALYCSGYSYFGVEYGAECYCGNTVACSSVKSLATNCTMTCSGNSTEYCGNGGYLNMYALPSVTGPSACPSPTSTSVTATGIIAKGCYVDGNTRALATQIYSNSSNTPSLCATACQQQGYKYSGTEYGQECWCGPNLPITAATASDCSSTCAGDSTQKCGGGFRLSVTEDTTWQQKLFARASYGTWNLMSCYQDNVNSQRTLPSGVAVGDSSSVTIAKCLDACAAKGFRYCGAEYYRECYGSAEQPADSLAVSGYSDPLLAGCNYACSGNSTEACGGANKVLVYTNNGTTTQ
ncbi:WSC domain-containing protein [Macrophomina phaseolina]|uniref:WSC domain-containing protein n=1 Tax=Macrophomina phaseolina TaxID=35725 RepID=A0ABQ8GUE5_9PEZI|nr:WSC domain-containing protein [Macrophomina phaseolina]